MLRTRTCRIGVIGVALIPVLRVPLHADNGYTPPVEVRTVEELPQMGSGLRFRQSLDSSIPGVTWKETPLRNIFWQISNLYQVAILVDRRIDPTFAPEVAVSNESLWGVIQELCRHVSAEPRTVGNCVYIGPVDRADLVRTLIELRKEGLLTLRNETSKNQWINLQRPRSVRWGDLTTPKEIIEQIAERFSFQVSGSELLPHDLCRGGAFPEMAAAEMVTLILVQYDLTFRWSDDLRSISIESMPSDTREIVVERSVIVTGAMRSRIKQQSSASLQLRFEGAKVVVRGRLEDVETFVAEVSGKRTKEKAGSSPGGVVPLQQREFTLAVTGVPIQAILENLERSGITFEYDSATFADRGVDLGTPVSVGLMRASAQEFFSAIFRPIAVDFVIDGTTVRLRPRN